MALRANYCDARSGVREQETNTSHIVAGYWERQSIAIFNVGGYALVHNKRFFFLVLNVISYFHQFVDSLGKRSEFAGRRYLLLWFSLIKL